MGVTISTLNMCAQANHQIVGWLQMAGAIRLAIDTNCTTAMYMGLQGIQVAQFDRYVSIFMNEYMGSTQRLTQLEYGQLNANLVNWRARGKDDAPGWSFFIVLWLDDCRNYKFE